MPARFSSARFVGRERELARLADALEAAVDGRASTVLVAGSGGLGASRLLDEAERRIAALPEPFVVVRCRSRPGRSGDAYAPIAAGLERLLAGFNDRDLAHVTGTSAEEIAKLIPGIVGRLGDLGLLPPRPTVTEPERRQTRMLESILGLLIRIGEGTPILLVLEDLHHADAGTRGLAAFLARVARPARLCLVMTYGPDRLSRGHPLLPELASITGGPTRRRSSTSARSTGSTWPSSSRRSRASARRPRPSSSSRSGPAATR